MAVSGRVTGKPPIEIQSEERNSHIRFTAYRSTGTETDVWMCGPRRGAGLLFLPHPTSWNLST